MTHSEKQPSILVVDDTPENIDVLRGVLGPHYIVKVATNGALALKIAAAAPPDLILLDVMMPEMDGYEVCRRLKEDEATRAIPVIFVTAKSDTNDETRGFELGAADYIAKPVSPPVVLARVRTHLSLRDQTRHLESLVQKRTRALERRTEELEAKEAELRETRVEIIRQLGRAAEHRDNETGMHVIRIGYMSRVLGRAVGMEEERAEMLMHASMMHDIGKIGVPDHILLKPGKLTDEEFAEIKRHPEIGAGIIGDHPHALLRMSRAIAESHHEKWNGGGYPKGLAGEAIPLEARIVALVDVFDALLSERPYKKAWSNEEAIDLIREERGRHFDPELTDLFLERVPALLEIRREYHD